METTKVIYGLHNKIQKDLKLFNTDVYSNYIVLNVGHTVTKMRGSESDPR